MVRMFPVTDRARTILDTLVDIINDLGVTIRMKDPVDSLIYDRETQRVKGLTTVAG